MFRPGTGLVNLGDFKSSGVVLEYFAVDLGSVIEDVESVFLHLLEEFHHWDGFAQGIRQAGVLSFCGRQCNLGLKL